MTQSTNVATSEALTSGQTENAIEGVYVPATFNAHVYDDVNGDGNQGGGEPNEPGITVELLTGSGVPTGKTAVTDANGNVSFTGLPPGSYEIAVLAPNGSIVTQATDVLTPTTLTSGQTTTATEGLFVPVTLDAHVYNDTNADGTQDNGEANLGGITVQLLTGTGAPTGKTAVTDSNGNVSFTGLPPGSYEIAVVKPQGLDVTQTTNVSTAITLSAGQTSQSIEGLSQLLGPYIPLPKPPPEKPAIGDTIPLGDYIPWDPTAQARQLYVEARNADGGPIPDWLTFDATTLSFSGSPPGPLNRPLVMIIVIRDNKGNQTFLEVPVLTGPSGDVTEFYNLLTGERLRNIIRHAFDPNDSSHSDVAPPQLFAPIQVADHVPIDPSARTFDGSLAGRTSFTTQLRAAGRMGRMAQARAMLDVWTGPDRRVSVN